MIKKLITLIVISMLAVLTLAGCGGSSGGGTDSTDGSGTDAGGASIDIESLKTLGDVYDAVEESNQEAFFEGTYVYVFPANGVYYRAIVDLPKDVEDQLWDLDTGDEDYEQKKKDLTSSLEIDRIENLNDKILSDEQLAEFTGKTGADLTEAGWISGMGYNLDEMGFYMEYDCNQYVVTMEGDVDRDLLDSDFEAGIKDMKVTGIRWEGIGDASNDLMPKE